MSSSNTRGAMKDNKLKKDDSVKVIVRCRPQSKQELKTNEKIILECSNDSVSVNNTTNKASAPKQFTFDNVYTENTSQKTLFHEVVEPVIEDVLAGYNCTIFAYGQTGTGKTYTMEGDFMHEPGSEIFENHAGIIPRAVHRIFERLDEVGEDYAVKVSFLELYNEELTDLIATTDANMDGEKKLRIFEDTNAKNSGIQIQNLEEVIVKNSAAVMDIMKVALDKRTSFATLLNQNSSRSHGVFTVTINTKEVTEDAADGYVIRTGKLHLVDLAGSECIGRSGAQDSRAREAGKINQSLLTLGRVINALVEGAGYIPYRDSKLTRILQESLGGRSKTVIVATISPSLVCVDETCSTLLYANRAKNIKNKPQVNQTTTGQFYMKELLKQLIDLKEANKTMREKSGVYLSNEKYQEMVNQLEENKIQADQLNAQIATKTEELETTNATLEEVVENLARTQTDLEQAHEDIAEQNKVLAQTRADLKQTQEALQFEQYYVKEQQDTEVVLLQQAEQTKALLQRMLFDKDVLHTVDELRQECASNNNILAAAFCARLLTEFASISVAVKEHCESHHAILSKLSSQLAEHRSQQIDDFENIRELAKNLGVHQEEQCKQMVIHVNEYVVAQAMASTADDSNNALAHEAATILLQRQQTEAQDQIASLAEVNEMQGAHTAKFVAANANWIAKTAATQKEFNGIQAKEISSMEEKAEAFAKAQISGLHANAALLTKLVAEQKNKNNERVEQTLTTFQTLLDKFSSIQHAKRTEAISIASKNIDSLQKDLSYHESSVDASLLLMEENMLTWKEQRIELHQQQDASTLKTYEAVCANVSTCLQKLQNFQNEHTQQVDSTHDASAERVEAFGVQKKECDDQLNSFAVDHKQQVESQYEKRTKMATLQDVALVDVENDCFIATEEWKTQLQREETGVQQFRQTDVKNQEEIHSVLTAYRLAEYAPPEYTPQQTRPFFVRSEFIRTESPESLLEQFRAEKQALIEASELRAHLSIRRKNINKVAAASAKLRKNNSYKNEDYVDAEKEKFENENASNNSNQNQQNQDEKTTVVSKECRKKQSSEKTPCKHPADGPTESPERPISRTSSRILKRMM